MDQEEELTFYEDHKLRFLSLKNWVTILIFKCTLETPFYVTNRVNFINDSAIKM